MNTYSGGLLPDHWRKAVEALGEVMEAEVLDLSEPVRAVQRASHARNWGIPDLLWLRLEDLGVA